jgi:glycosyltransferase involved in cell wall biosynthesis
LKVSVIVATRNRSALLARTLDALARQSFARDAFEIVVADNGSTDATADVIRAAAAGGVGPPIQHLFVETPGKSYAVNAAFAVARGRIFALTDDDVVPDPCWLASLVDVVNEHGAAFVAGRVLPLWETPPPSWMSPALHGVLAIPDNGDQPFVIDADNPRIVPIGANMAIRRDVVGRIGGLREDLGKLEGSLRTGEDHEFFLRMLHAGYDGRYEPRALVHHFVPRERLDRGYFRRWLYQNGQDVARLRRAYPWNVRRLFGVPRYLWREAAGDVWTMIRAAARGDEAARFAAEVRLTWLGGYAYEAWFPAAEGRA